MSEADTVEALTRSVVAIDASRRVGWARSFEATSREESAQRDLNVLRGDLAILSKFAAYAVGVLQGLGSDFLLRPEYSKAISYLPDGPRRKGRENTRKWIEEGDDRLAIKKERQQQLKNENSRLWKAARKKQCLEMVRKFGFPDEDAMNEWLRKYKAGSGV